VLRLARTRIAKAKVKDEDEKGNRKKNCGLSCQLPQKQGQLMSRYPEGKFKNDDGQQEVEEGWIHEAERKASRRH
jgi:hypothetical protein